MHSLRIYGRHAVSLTGRVLSRGTRIFTAPNIQQKVGKWAMLIDEPNPPLIAVGCAFQYSRPSSRQTLSLLIKSYDQDLKMTEKKRPSGSEQDAPRKKRSRFEPVAPSLSKRETEAKSAANGLSAVDKVQKVQLLLASKETLKAQIQALKERRALSASSQTISQSQPASARQAKRPGPLRVDAQGREIDLSRSKALNSLESDSQQVDASLQNKSTGPRPEDFVDPLLVDKSFKRLYRKQRTGFDFVKAGTFQKEAEQRRLKAAFGDQALKQHKERFTEGDRKAAGSTDQLDANLVPLGQRVIPQAAEAVFDPIPDVEWWDIQLLLEPHSYSGIEEGKVNEKKITIYVEHPVPLEPPAEDAPPPPMPLPLTQKERKKLRTQRRLEREKEKQELIRQGLLEPPKPKMKLSTFYRSMGVEAAADPTAIEAQVRADQEARQQAHEDRNLANKLTPAEKREKKIKKLTGEADEGEARLVSVYKLTSLASPQHRFKIRANAEELHMTGCAVITDEMAIVVAEGGPKAQKKYQHLLLNRIKWNPDEEDEDEVAPSKPRNSCSKVWSGTVKAAAFKKFWVETCQTESAAQQYLADHGIQHYWTLAVSDKDQPNF